MKLKIIFVSLFMIFLSCSEEKNNLNFLNKIKINFPLFKHSEIIYLSDLINTCFISGEKPALVKSSKLKAIEQKIFSTIDYYFELKKNSKLIFSIYGERGTLFKINISAEGTDNDLIFSKKIDKKFKPSIYSIDLSKYNNKIIKLSFYIEGKERGYWINPLIVHKENKEENIENTKLLKFKKKLIEKAKKWNLVYIVLDAGRPDHFSCYGYKFKTTPNIDKLAKESLIFENAFTQAVYTLASTASLFTGLYPDSHYVLMDHQSLSEKFYTMAEAFRDKGYLTLAEVSNPYASFNYNMNQGFTFFKENWKTKNIFLNSESLDIIKKEKKNFFLYLHYPSPHAPYNSPLKFRRKFITKLSNPKFLSAEYLTELDKNGINLSPKEIEELNKLYDANLNYADHYVGKVVNLLKRENLLKNSILIITSDHGEAFFEHGRLQHNSTVFDEMIKVPLIIKFPEEAGIAPRRISHLVEIIDLTKTFFELFELPNKMDYKLEGKSIFPIIFLNKPVKDFIFSRTVIPLSNYCIRNQRYKYILELKTKNKDPKGKLYDLKSDPEEKFDVKNKNPYLTFYLHQKLLEHLVFAQNIIDKEKEKYIEIDEKTRERLRSLGYIE